jgi:WXG100 family type VII secretion target
VGQSVEVVVSELNSAAARMSDAAQRLQDGLTSVNDETTQLLGGGWKGQAASAYAPAWQKWDEGAKQVVTALQRMSELLTIAGKEYAKTDEQSAGALGSSMQGSGGSAAGGGSGSGGGGASQAGGSAAGGSSTGGSSTGEASAGAASQASGSDIGQLLQPLTQIAQTVAGLPQQAGQALGGLTQVAAQLATELVEAAEQVEQQDKPESDHDDGDPADGAAAHESGSGRAPIEDPDRTSGGAVRRTR